MKSLDEMTLQELNQLKFEVSDKINKMEKMGTFVHIMGWETGTPSALGNEHRVIRFGKPEPDIDDLTISIPSKYVIQHPKENVFRWVKLEKGNEE